VDHDNLPHKKQHKMPFWKVATIVALIAFILVSAIAYAIKLNEFKVSDVTSNHHFKGESLSSVEETLQVEGVDETMYTVNIDDPNELSDGNYIVSTVKANDDHAYITAVPNPKNVLASMDLVGKPWKEVKQELESLDYSNGFDYLVHTDKGQIYRDEHWSVYDIDTDKSITGIYVTNDVRNSVEDFGENISDKAGEKWKDFKNKVEE